MVLIFLCESELICINKRTCCDDLLKVDESTFEPITFEVHSVDYCHFIDYL